MDLASIGQRGSHTCAAAIVKASDRNSAMCIVTPLFEHGPPIASYLCTDRTLDAPGVQSLCTQVKWSVPGGTVSPGGTASPGGAGLAAGAAVGVAAVAAIGGTAKYIQSVNRSKKVDEAIGIIEQHAQAQLRGESTLHTSTGIKGLAPDEYNVILSDRFKELQQKQGMAHIEGSQGKEVRDFLETKSRAKMRAAVEKALL